MADPDDAPAHKRPRLDSVNPTLYNTTPSQNGHPLPPPPPPPPHHHHHHHNNHHHQQPPPPPRHFSHPQHPQHPQHPSPVHQASPSPSRPYPHHALPQPPQPPQPYPAQAQSAQPQSPYPGSQPSPSLPPSDIRAYSDPRTIPPLGQRSHGVAAAPPVNINQDTISTYRPPPTPQSTSAPDAPASRSTSISISTDIKSQPPSQGMEHGGGHQSPWSMTPEHRPNGSISNGYSHTISPPHNDQGFHPPPPPGQQYGQSAGSYAPSPYMSQYSGSAAQQVRRKQVRATQACNHCRTRKQKCDEARPCQFCRENNFDCQYKDVPPPKQDRSMMMLQDSVNDMSNMMKEFMGDLNVWRQSVESRLPPTRALDITSHHPSPEASFAIPSKDNTSTWPASVQQRNQQLSRMGNIKMGSPNVTHQHMSPGGPQRSTPIKQEAMLVAPQQPATPAESVRTDHSRATDSAPKEKNGLQSDHTTPAHKLLEEWPSMINFCRDVDYLNRLKENGQDVSEYPMQLEQNRGLLRVWGVGEGQDLNDGAQGPGSPESSNDSDAYSPAPGREGLWGHPPVDQSSPSTSTANGDGPSSHPSSEGGLGPDGRPNFHSRVLWQLYESYITNMHNLHPFMNPSKIRRMFQEFSEQYSPDVKSNSAASPNASSLASHFSQGVKRKRSGSAFGEPYSSKGAIERSLRNAIVLLILALGKVCDYKDQLPSPQSDKGSAMSGAWGLHKESPHANGSFSSDPADDHRPRNIDILPGMAYYAYATDILGNQQGGNTVAHAQAMILAALYLSQYARVMESWSWINNACRITMILVKADYAKLHRDFYIDPAKKASLSPKERYRLNLVMCVYWTCLQLESDILAEMSTLPPSKVSDYQSDIMYPEGVYESVPIDATPGTQEVRSETGKNGVAQDGSMLMYSSQIWLRVILNEAHNTLYGTSGNRGFDTSNLKDVAEHAKSHLDVLESWRRVLPSSLAWKDDDPPSTDLNVARLRAKYYGGLYMILRPYLRIANHSIDLPPVGASTAWGHQQNSPTPTADSVSTPTSRGVQLVELSDDQRSIIWIAAKCINSAIQSTIAFDRVGARPNSPYEKFKCTRKRRLVVTNIFGTMHAQFGNMLVLAAVYKSQLHRFLPKHAQLTKATLAALLERTCSVLSEAAPNSPILEMDLKILHNVRRQHDLF